MEQILGPKAAPPLNANGGHSAEVIVKLVPTALTSDQDTMIEAEAVTLVHCRLYKQEEDRDRFKNLKLKPVYWREFRVKRSNPSPIHPNSSQHPLQSLWHPHLMSLTMVFTSNNEGYIYHLPGHIRKPGRGLGVKRVALCPFTRYCISNKNSLVKFLVTRILIKNFVSKIDVFIIFIKKFNGF